MLADGLSDEDVMSSRRKPKKTGANVAAERKSLVNIELTGTRHTNFL